MRRLSLRSRLLLAFGIVAVVQVAAALFLVAQTRDQLLDEVDDRLETAVDAARRDPAQDFDPISDVYRGRLADDGSLETLSAITERGALVPPPRITERNLLRALDGPTTVNATGGGERYRIVAVPADGETLVIGSHLDGYEWTLNRVSRLVAIAAGLVMVVLAAATWWVLRHGIAPVKRMTASADAIAAGDFSQRVDDTDPSTEAGQLGIALNTMMGRIETSFQEREKAEAQLRQFIADASHELRTPVATIRGYADLYASGGLDDRNAMDDAMHRTRMESERMSRLIADMLNLAKLDRRPSVNRRPLDLRRLSDDVVADARIRNGRRSITSTGPGPVQVGGDEDLLRQAITNLVANAEVHGGPTATTTVETEADGSHAIVCVTDDGDGMSAEVAAQATERFYRGDDSRSRASGGSGLGLAIVVGIVDAHDGTLEIDSAPGAGTSVTLRIPLTDPLGDDQDE